MQGRKPHFGLTVEIPAIDPVLQPVPLIRSPIHTSHSLDSPPPLERDDEEIRSPSHQEVVAKIIEALDDVCSLQELPSYAAYRKVWLESDATQTLVALKMFASLLFLDFADAIQSRMDELEDQVLKLDLIAENLLQQLDAVNEASKKKFAAILDSAQRYPLRPMGIQVQSAYAEIDTSTRKLNRERIETLTLQLETAKEQRAAQVLYSDCLQLIQIQDALNQCMDELGYEFVNNEHIVSVKVNNDLLPPASDVSSEHEIDATVLSPLDGVNEDADARVSDDGDHNSNELSSPISLKSLGSDDECASEVAPAPIEKASKTLSPHRLFHQSPRSLWFAKSPEASSSVVANGIEAPAYKAHH